MTPRRLLTLLASTSFSVALVALSSNPASGQAEALAEDKYKAGKAAFEKQDWRTAIEALSDVLKLTRRADLRLNSLYFRGYAQSKNGKCEGAMSDLRQVLKLNPPGANAQQVATAEVLIKDCEKTVAKGRAAAGERANVQAEVARHMVRLRDPITGPRGVTYAKMIDPPTKNTLFIPDLAFAGGSYDAFLRDLSVSLLNKDGTSRTLMRVHLEDIDKSESPSALFPTRDGGIIAVWQNDLREMKGIDYNEQACNERSTEVFVARLGREGDRKWVKKLDYATFHTIDLFANEGTDGYFIVFSGHDTACREDASMTYVIKLSADGHEERITTVEGSVNNVSRASTGELFVLTSVPGARKKHDKRSGNTILRTYYFYGRCAAYMFSNDARQRWRYVEEPFKDPNEFEPEVIGCKQLLPLDGGGALLLSDGCYVDTDSNCVTLIEDGRRRWTREWKVLKSFAPTVVTAGVGYIASVERVHEEIGTAEKESVYSAILRKWEVSSQKVVWERRYDLGKNSSEVRLFETGDGGFLILQEVIENTANGKRTRTYALKTDREGFLDAQASP